MGLTVTGPAAGAAPVAVRVMVWGEAAVLEARVRAATRAPRAPGVTVSWI